MQILFIQNFYDDQPTGGAELLCHDIAKGLEKLGHKIIVLSTKRGRAGLNREDQIFLKSHPVVNEEEELKKISSKLKWAFISRNNYFITKKVIKTINPDVVYLHNLEWVTTSPLLAAAESGRKVVLHAHNHQYYAIWKSSVEDQPDSLLHRYFKLTANINAARVIAISQFIADELLQNGFPESKIQVIFNGLSSDFLTNTATNCFRERKAIFAGAISPHKGVHIAIKAIGYLRKQGIVLPLEIIGTAGRQNYLKELKELVSNSGLGKQVIFFGSLSRKEVSQRFRTTELFLFPSLWEEPFGLVAIEAMANGAIVIGSNRGAIPEVIGEAGFVVMPEAAELARTIKMVLELSEEEKEKRRLIGQQRVKELFSLEKNILQIEKVLSA